jgi:hypothetical protein
MTLLRWSRACRLAKRALPTIFAWFRSAKGAQERGVESDLPRTRFTSPACGCLNRLEAAGVR